MVTKTALLMKLAFVMIMATWLSVPLTGYSQGTRLSADFNEASIKTIFQFIEGKTNYKFVYANNFFPADLKLSIHVKDAQIENILSSVLQNTGFTFKIIEDLIVITIVPSEKERQPVRGKIMGVNGEPLAGVTVAAENGKLQTATDSKGEFSINVPSSGTLVFSSVGYITETVQVNGTGEIELRMTESVEDLGEVIMIGYGQRLKRDVTAAVSVLNSANIEKNPSLSPQLAMQGQMAGVNVISGGSSPTARPTVRIRGVGTFSGNGAADPLYIIDGIPIVEGGAGATVDKVNDPTRRGPVNLFAIINPNDIQSISVLKDASAAVYGVRAANGVILITTKTGKKGKMRVEADALFGTQKIPKTYDVLNTEQYVKFYTGAYYAYPELRGSTPVSIRDASNFGPRWDPQDPSYFGNDPTYDWQNSIINTDSKIQNYNVRAGGGTENTNYSFSFGYAGNDGPFIGYNANRYSVATNFSTSIGKYVEIGMNLRGAQQTTKNPPGDLLADVNLEIWRAPPWQKIYDPAGPYGFAPLWKLNSPVTPSLFDKSSLYAQQYVAYRNVHGLLATSENTITDQTGLGTGYLQVQPLAGLRIKGTISVQQTSISSESWQDFDRWFFMENPGNPYTNVVNPVAGTKPGFVGIANSQTSSILKSANADYQHKFGQHYFNITLDASQQEYKWTGNGASRSVLSSDPNLRYFSITGNENGYYELRAAYALVGYMARASYNFNNTYYIEGVVRRDGSSRFAPGHQWGTFPSGSVGWRISKEKFMKSLGFLDDLKIRASYGVLGNEQTTGGWSYLSVANVVQPSYNLGSPQVIYNGISYPNFPNTDLTWERLGTTSVGFDALLFKNKFSVTADIYHKITKGIIQNVELTPSSGITNSTDINIAEVLNKGFELQLGYNNVFGNVGVALNANFTTVHNEVLQLAGNTALRTLGLEKGLPIGFIYGYKVGGIFQSQSEIDSWKSLVRDIISKEQKPGDIYFQNLYGRPSPGSTRRNLVKDSVIDENDRAYLGKIIPGYYYGFTARFNYKWIDLSVFVQGVGDVQQYNASREFGENMSEYGRNQFSSVLNAWTEQNRSTDMPRAVYSDPNGNARVSDRFVENAGYIRLQNLQVGFTVPRKWLGSPDVVEGIRLYFTGANLFTITRYSGLDPENDYFPNTRQYLFGIKASF